MNPKRGANVNRDPVTNVIQDGSLDGTKVLDPVWIWMDPTSPPLKKTGEKDGILGIYLCNVNIFQNL